MSDKLELEKEPLTADEEEMMRGMLREMDALNLQIRQEKTRIINHKKRWSHLATESDRLKAEIRASLARLGESI